MTEVGKTTKKTTIIDVKNLDEKPTIPERIRALGTASDDIYPREPMGFFCKLCPFRGRDPILFKKHLVLKHNKKRPRIYYCDLCPKSYAILKSFRVHTQTVHGVTVEELLKIRRQKEPVISEPESPAQEDDIFLIPGTSKDEIKMNVQPPHKKARQQSDIEAKCPGCKTSCSSKRDYMNHIEDCKANGNWYPCGVRSCGKTFWHRENLIKHLKLDHQCV